MSTLTVQPTQYTLTVTEDGLGIVSVGTQGTPGPAGPGVPAGGAINTFLKKQSATDYDTVWFNLFATANTFTANQSILASLDCLSLSAGSVSANGTVSANALTASVGGVTSTGGYYGGAGSGLTDLHAENVLAGVFIASQVFTAPLIVRQPGGVAGTDEVQVSHDGSAARWSNKDTGGYLFRDPADAITLLSIEKASTADGSGRISTGGSVVRVGAGSGAGANLNATAQSVFVGHGAGSGSGGSQHVVIGHGANSAGESFRLANTVVGYNASADNENNVAVGATARAGQGGVAVGYVARAQGNGVAIGHQANAYTTIGGVAIGHQAVAGGVGQVVFQADSAVAGSPAHACNVYLQGYSSTNTPRSIGAVGTDWADSTDATRTGRLTLGAYSVTTHQEGVRVEANAAGVRLGFFGGAAVFQPAVTGSRADPEAALANLLTQLAALGLITDSTTA